MTEDENNLTVEEVVSICNNAPKDAIEIKEGNPFNSKTDDFIDKYDINPDQIVSIINGLS